MPRTLTASDRSRLIRLASTMVKGSPERKALLNRLAGRLSPAAQQEYDALTRMIPDLDGMQSFLLNPTRHKSDERLTAKAGDQIESLRATLVALRRKL
jgi:hypothetical protein